MVAIIFGMAALMFIAGFDRGLQPGPELSYNYGNPQPLPAPASLINLLNKKNTDINPCLFL